MVFVKIAEFGQVSRLFASHHLRRLLEAFGYLFCGEDFSWTFRQAREQYMIRSLVREEPAFISLSPTVVLGRFPWPFKVVLSIIRSFISGDFSCFNLCVGLFHQTLVNGWKDRPFCHRSQHGKAFSVHLGEDNPRSSEQRELQALLDLQKDPHGMDLGTRAYLAMRTWVAYGK
nr:hypothetical protein [Tanacetum cinerariifolium]